MKTTQKQRIASHFKRGWKLTQLDALNKYGCMRLASRVSDLRNEGMDIRTRQITRNGKTFAEYQLAR